ncbi:inositol monophosphatase family protein [Rhizohabitans arisaemae]|uniref:inositol monophosphatase family protein n=1 Tax=Rhizohabitans arisaemae TaxID=2720610 RepID=UPI0024B0D442|nr:inositol monophosphatase [Rhizohabitans arisaemae]
MRLDTGHARQVAVEAAEAAGHLLLEGRRKHFDIQAKGTAGDLVTDLDRRSEDLIISRIRRDFPGHRIVAEESGVLDAADDRWTWLVDPLDGTNNFAVKLPIYVVGICLCEDGVPIVGVVYDPENGETWSAVRGEGALGPTGTARRAPYVPARHGPNIAWTQGHTVHKDDGTARALKMILMQGSRRLYQLWAPLMSWAMLARGDIDGFIGYRAGIVDLPAGMLIAQEAGMAVRNLDGTPYDEWLDPTSAERSFVAGHPELIDDLLTQVKTAHAVQGRLEELFSP